MVPSTSSPAAARGLGGDGLLARYVRLLQRRSGAVALAWLAAFAVGIFGVTRVFANLKLQARAAPRGLVPAKRPAQNRVVCPRTSSSCAVQACTSLYSTSGGA
jgi:hypothetical protein